MKINFFKSFISKFHQEPADPNFSSSKYWEERYYNEGNSGPGSYGRLAVWKSQIINEFVEKNGVKDVLELGCGDGNQLSLAKYPSYRGFDVSDLAIEICRKKFKEDDSKRFFSSDLLNKENNKSELVLSLDVIFHLIEDEVFYSYMTNLFRLSSKYVIIYSSNYDKVIAEHVKCRKFTKWIEENVVDFRLIQKIPNKYPFERSKPDTTSMSDFYIFQKK